MKKLVLFSTVLGAFVFGSKEVFAVTPATSEGTATLQTLDESEAGTVSPQITDPENPTGTGQTGLLTLDAVPTFDFQGTGLAGTFTDTLTQAQSDASYVRNAQITDRRGTGAGWSLGLNISGFKNAEVPLNGVSITIPVDVAAGLDNTSTAPSVVNAVSGVVDPVNGLDAGTIVAANVGEGYGTWLAKFSGASLEIADGNAAGSYKSTFTWTVSTTPIGE